MNKKDKYFGDTRYEKVWEQMKLLGIQDVTTNRQHRNGTIVWKLPIKNWNSGKTNIEVASFSTGYVRNQNSGYSNYQLNKRCQNEPMYFKDYEWQTKGVGDNCKQVQVWTGKYRKFETRGCKLIPIEIDRLEYLLKYCIKNYYIKNANQVPDGKFVPKWKYDNACENGHKMLHEQKQFENQRVEDYKIKLEEKLFDLQNKLATIKRIADYE